MNSYPKGTKVRCFVTIKDIIGVLVSPSGGVLFWYRTPETDTKTVAAATLISTGSYRGDMILNYPGPWYYGFTWSGDYEGAAEGECCCRETHS